MVPLTSSDDGDDDDAGGVSEVSAAITVTGFGSFISSKSSTADAASIVDAGVSRTKPFASASPTSCLRGSSSQEDPRRSLSMSSRG